MKKFLTVILAATLSVFCLCACSSKEDEEAKGWKPIPEYEVQQKEAAAKAKEEETAMPEVINQVPKSEQTGTAGSNIPLKDNLEEAKYQIEVALQYKFAEDYGESINDARIYVDKVYSAEDEQAVQPIKEMNLGMNDVAFEVHYELHPSEGADINTLLIPNGEYDEGSGWIKDITRVGVLRENADETSDQKYIITDFGTGW